MILRTETYRELEEDLATIMDIDESYLYEKLYEISKSCPLYSDWDKYEKQIERLILECVDLDLIDEVYVYHLSRHLIEPKELIPLKDLLLSENRFSTFLKEHNVVFDEQDGKLRFFYVGRQITADEILASGHFHLLAKRLGYLGEPDFCVNGFAFWPNIEKTSDHYFQDLQRGPEIIENIGRFIGKDIWRDYTERSNYYGIVFKVPIEELVFDGRDDIDTKEGKVKCLIKNALYYLNDFYDGSIRGNNLMLRIPDDKKVEVDHYILIEETQY